jgi:hypothetical protein
MKDIFGESFGSLFGSFLGLGSHPEPPDIVPLRILGLAAMPVTQDAAKAAFRARLKQVHPDVDAYTSVPELQEAADAQAVARPEVAEVVWARDVLLRKVPATVTGNKVPGENLVTRNVHNPKKCKRCEGVHVNFGGTVHGFYHGGRWRGYCWPCGQDAENERQRDLRRQRRTGRKCCGCGERFTPQRADGRYCSSACRQAAYRVRKVQSDG